MKSPHLSNSIKAAVLVTALSCGASLRATTVPAIQSLNGMDPGLSRLQAPAFSDTVEAKKLRTAYRLLESCDHDYDGHRKQAMLHVEKAAKQLGLELSGDLNAEETKLASDERMLHALDLIHELRQAAALKDQPKVVNQLTEAAKAIKAGLHTTK
jgi:hypothetical protein